jgi:hypothetical protein
LQTRAVMNPKHCWPVLLLSLARPAHALEGRAYVAFAGQAGIARGEMSRLVPGLTPGWDFRFGAGLRGIPLTVGLGGGALSYSSQSFAGPSGVFSRGDEIGFGPTTIVRSTEMRHFDLVARLEPEWRWVRPFAEATVGTAQFFVSTRLSTDWQGLELDSAESSKSPTLGWGWALGLNVEPFRIYAGPQGTLGLAFSAGVRGFDSLPVGYSVHLPNDPQGRLVAVRSRFQMLAPFLGLTIVSRSPGSHQ